MPQPLTTIRPGPYTFDFKQGAEKKSAALLPLAVSIISAASMADVGFARLLAPFTHGRVKPVVDYFISLRNDAPKLAVIEALAAAALSPERFALFKAVSRLYETASKLRQPIAHWMWGHCAEIPDALLLVDPRHWLEEQGLADPIRVKINQAYLANDMNGIRAQQNELARLQISRLSLVMVYREKDFTDIAAQCWQATDKINEFHVVLGWDAVNKAKADELAQQLAQRPEIASLLAAQQPAQKALL